MTPLAERLYDAFWAAAKVLGEGDGVHPMEVPYFEEFMSMIDTSGCGMPKRFWEHMARAFRLPD